MSADENLANAVRDFLVNEWLCDCDEETMKRLRLESPIEALFLKGMFLANQLLVDVPKLIHRAPIPGRLAIENQAKIARYRVDFLLSVVSKDGVRKNLVVECDGHNYHERTKEQAAADRAKDRALQELGYSVYRFTGSELYRDAFACARQVFRWADNAFAEAQQ